MLTENFVLMAKYNRWMNSKLYAAADDLTDEELEADRGAFFNSILGTLNHDPNAMPARASSNLLVTAVITTFIAWFIAWFILGPGVELSDILA